MVQIRKKKHLFRDHFFSLLFFIVFTFRALAVKGPRGGGHMLQTMQKTVTAEGKTDEALFQKFSCYCKNSGGELSASIAAADSKSVAVAADIEEGTNAKAQLDADLKAHKADRDAAKNSVSQADAIRAKEFKAFTASSAEHNSNIGFGSCSRDAVVYIIYSFFVPYWSLVVL